MFAKGSGIESVPLRYHANEVVGLVECAGKLEELSSVFLFWQTLRPDFQTSLARCLKDQSLSQTPTGVRDKPQSFAPVRPLTRRQNRNAKNGRKRGRNRTEGTPDPPGEASQRRTDQSRTRQGRRARQGRTGEGGSKKPSSRNPKHNPGPKGGAHRPPPTGTNQVAHRGPASQASVSNKLAAPISQEKSKSLLPGSSLE